MITVIGDQLYGRMENGESVREVVGNVVLTQGNVRITCSRAIQYLARNNAHLIGNVVITQDSLTILTDEGFYFGNEKRAYSDRGVKLDDKKVILTAGIGEYLFTPQQANFSRDVKLTDTLSVLTSARLTYFREIDKAIAVEQVNIIDTSGNIIKADSLINLRKEQITYAFYNVRVRNLRDNSLIMGEHLEDYREKGYSLVDVNPVFMQVDTVKNESDTIKAGVKDRKETDSLLQIDTLVIRSLVMESYRTDTSNQFIAKDSVRILRGGFASHNDYTIYYKDKETIVTNKVNDSAAVPVIWYDNSQMTGDSITIRLSDRRIDRVFINNNAFMISKSEINPRRYDQLTGKRVIMNFADNQLNKTEVYGNVLGIYFMYEEEEQNGLMKASSREAIIFFEERKVSQVNLYGDPNSEYHPENVVEGNEKSYTLPGFTLYEGRPTMENLFTKKIGKVF
ncbi:MAG: LPS export ABC transporter periplasmic protein LptC [Ignavibacteriaceae bacterium]|nr:LPS export ABC transporter periplasmic protein LptC [Ignavibacteriaceae bacterium]